MKLKKIQIADDTFIYVEKGIYNKLKKDKRTAIGVPCGFFTTTNAAIIDRIKKEIE